MSSQKNIERLYRVIHDSVFMTTGSLDYGRVTEAVTKLANAVHRFPMSDDGYEIWDIGEGGCCDLSSFLVGAYWHYTEWHGGQSSPEYVALSALGRVFSPGMADGPEPDSSEFDAYTELEFLAKESAGESS